MTATVSHNVSRSRRSIGGLILIALLGFAVLGPLLVSADPARQDLQHTLERPSVERPLGTDHLGRSMLARVASAARLSLWLAVVSVLSAAIPGTAIGIWAAWQGGWIERVLVAVADAVLALPGLLLVVLFSAFAPGGFWPLYVGLSLVFWVEYFRVVRAKSQALLAGPQVEATRLLGFGPWYVVRRHLLPELAPVLATLMTFGAATAVLSLAALGFVGVGLRPPVAELGLMMTELLPHYREAPWLIAAPIVVLMVTVLGLTLVAGDEPPR